MNFKKKRSIWQVIRAALVILVFIWVPMFLLIIAAIKDDKWLYIVGGLYFLISWKLAGRIDGWVM